MCVVIFPSSLGKSHFGVVLAPVGAAYTLPVLWYSFEWAAAEGVLEGMFCCYWDWARMGHMVLAW